jgi:two-component system cell cycle response regulator DivK
MVAAKGDTMAGELILMIEDNPLNAKLVRDVLLASGYQLVESTTAEEGLQLARERKPALILMDIRLPGMDGIAALAELKGDATTRQIPVIAVTASVMPMEREEILAAGFDGYQAKPISVKSLRAEVRALLDRAAGDTP